MLVRFENQVIWLEFDQLPVGNSFGLDQAEQMDRALTQYSLAKALVVTHQGRWFCAGGNLKDYSKTIDQPQDGRQKNLRIRGVLDRLHSWPGLTIALVNGDCFGGGVEVLSAFDLVLSTPRAFFGLWQRRIGLTFGWGGGARLAQRLSQSSLRTQALLANSISAYSALRIGLIDEILPEAQLVLRANQLIEQYAQWTALPTSEIKQWTTQTEQEIFARLWGNPEHRKVLQAWQT